MTDSSRHERNFEHATWRVNFLHSLLKAHRLLAQRGDSWRVKEAEYLERLAVAEKERERWAGFCQPRSTAAAAPGPAPTGREAQAPAQAQARQPQARPSATGSAASTPRADAPPPARQAAHHRQNVWRR